MPYTNQTEGLLANLADLRPATLATMHGSANAGDGRRMLNELAVAMKEVFGAS